MQLHSFIQIVKQRYIDLWNKPFGVTQLLGSIVFINAMGLWIPSFLNFIQNRKGFYIEDVVLNTIPAIDVSMPLFVSCYFVIVIAIFLMATEPKIFTITLQTYALLTLIRMLCIYLVPLEAPVAYVDLKDPFAELFVYAGKPINKDLFFSGHTSTMVLLVLGNPFKKLKPVFIFFAFVVAFLLLVQHAHYFIDVLVAPFATIACFAFVKALHHTKINRLTGEIKVYENKYKVGFLQKTIKN
jgi:hypothetical protein